MSTFTLRIEMGNAAFEEASELPHLLHRIANHLSTLELTSTSIVASSIYDSNGNRAGSWTIE